MDSFVVSALKYRPQTFRSVVGQDALTTTLKNAVKTNKLAHAYLFCGPRGVGKTTCARIFAKTINCQNLTPEYEACNVCESCRTFNEQRSFNIHELDAASNNSVDDIRSLTDQVRIPPQVGRYSVYIIDEVHMLSQGAFNAFLKTLEEPPAHALFILATTEKHKIIPTILSRCQIYDFNRISITDTANHLRYVAEQEGISIDDNALNVIAQKSDGGMRDALSIFDQLVSFCGEEITYQAAIDNLNVLDYEYYFRIVDYALRGDISSTLLVFNDVLNKGFDAGHFITGFSSHLRDVLVCKDPVTIPLLEVGADIGERYKVQAADCAPDFIFEALHISNECDLNYRLSKNKRLLVELALIRICQLGIGKDKGSDNDTNTPPLQKIVPSKIATPPTSAEQLPAAAPASGTIQPTAGRPASEQPKPVVAHAPAAGATPANSLPPRPTIPNAPKSISISTIKADKPSVEPETKPSEQPLSKEQFSNEALIEQWMLYSKKENLDAGTRAFLQTHLPTKLDESTIEVRVDNKFQEKELLQMDILFFLRQALSNREIQLKTTFTPETAHRKFQTPQETYKRMAEDFPVLEKLRGNLGMEVD